ncbi:MAG: acyl-CoA dehydrogenase family protein [Bacteriovoracaceae bacterium]|nr:acyl-CoA dehydrogenase family protein [Bacteriovoracaceae bacterium]
MENSFVIQELVKQIDRLGKEVIWPAAIEADEEEKFDRKLFSQLGEIGLLGMVGAEEYGGSNLNYSDYVSVLERLAYYSLPYAVTASVSIMVQKMIEDAGSEAQKKQYLEKLISGEMIGSFALSESHSGSDAAALKTTAKKVSGGFELQGSKMWITSGGLSGVYVVMARTGEKEISAFLVPDGAPGFTLGKKEKKMGWKLSPTRELIFQNCFVSETQLLGKVGEGFKLALSALNKGRVTIGAVAVGLSQMALDLSLAFSKERKQFNTLLNQFQGIQFMLADMATETYAARALVMQAAQALGNPQSSLSQKNASALTALCSMAKLKATDVGMQVTTDAVQIHGGVGYTSEYHVERLMRDAKALQIVEGTNQIQRMVIARNL